MPVSVPAQFTRQQPTSDAPPPVPLPDFVVVDGVNGQNEVKKRMNGAILVPSSGQNPIVVPGATGSNPGRATVFYQTPSTDSAEIFGLNAWPPNDDVVPYPADLIYCSITTSPQGGGVKLMNRPIPYRHVFGNSFQPMMIGPSTAVNPVDNGLAAPIPLMRNSTLAVEFFSPLYADTTPDGTSINTSILIRDRNFRATDVSDPVSATEMILMPVWLAPSNNLVLGDNVLVGQYTYDLPGVTVNSSGTTYVNFLNDMGIGMFVTGVMIDFYSTGLGAITTGNVNIEMSLVGNRSMQNIAFNSETCMGSSADIQQGFGSGRILELSYPIWLSTNDSVTMNLTAGRGFTSSTQLCAITLVGVGSRALK